MPGKQLYGKGKQSSKSKRSAGTAAPGAGNGWLTLMSGLPEHRQHDAIQAALREGGPSSLSPETCDALAPSLVEYATARGADCDEAWVGLIVEVFGDMGVVLGEDANDEVGDAAERAGAEGLLTSLRRHGVVCTEPPPPPPMKAGAAVLAVLQEDGEWHAAAVEKVVPPLSGEGPPVVIVKFNEWPKVQETKRSAVVALTEVADDEGATERDGCCELCGRQLKLTFHHLVPKETHGRYIGKGLPSGVAEAAAAKGLQPEPTRELLNTYGAELCRFCHSTVHRLAPNAVLAERFNTIACLCAQPELAKFAAFASSQRNTMSRAR